MRELGTWEYKGTWNLTLSDVRLSVQLKISAKWHGYDLKFKTLEAIDMVHLQGTKISQIWQLMKIKILVSIYLLTGKEIM